MPINVRLLDHTTDPIRSLYVAYRTAYSALRPQTIVDRIEADKITREQMLEFVEKRLETGHASPLEQVWFEFAVSGVSRAFSHQFVRHHIGISFEQQSQRYVAFKKGEFPYTVPETVKRAGMADKMEEAFGRLGELYQEMIDAGVPAEDARFLIPNAANTNFKVVVNFLELLHICDLRLCTRAQWEFRQVASQMRAEIHRRFPELAQYIQPKCGDKRWGYCDESIEDWQACPIGRKRPHKKQLFELFDAHRRGELAPLAEGDFEIIEQVGASVATAGSAKAAAAIVGNGERAPEGTPPSVRDEG
ncbi:MAG: FAD-dependent thymidylate synthase [Chloroflexota bacterium]|nr:FAD-dependent thymidylate synthase [Chloroflexota bacterium]